MTSRPALTLDSVLRRGTNMSWRDVDGETVLLDTRGRVLRGLNAIGGLSWELADGTRTIRAIAAAIAHQTGADDSRVQKDVLVFFTPLLDTGAVESVGSR